MGITGGREENKEYKREARPFVFTIFVLCACASWVPAHNCFMLALPGAVVEVIL